MLKSTLTYSLLLIATCSYSQMRISGSTILTSGNDTEITTVGDISNESENIGFGNGSHLILTGNTQTVLTSQLLIVPNLEVTGGGVKTISGQLLVNEGLFLDNGLIDTGSSPTLNRLVLDAQSTISGGGSGAYISGPLTHLGGGTKFFPIGTREEYAPVSLLDITGTESTATSLMAYKNNDRALPKELPIEIDSVSHSWSWSFLSRGFASATAQLPLLNEDAGLVGSNNQTPVVIQVDSLSKAATNLGGALVNNAVNSASSPLGIPSYLLIGTSLVVTPLIHNLITLNNDGQNDYLVVENIDIYANNEVIILDRWGTEVFRKKGFINYDEFENPYDGSFDFLEPGNYICIVKYAGRSAKQMVTVLK